jgi:hypothetical protein
MKKQFKLFIGPVVIIFGLILFYYSGCEKAPYIVDTTDTEVQAYLFSYSSESVASLSPFFSTENYLKDSALTLEYIKYENIANKSIDSNEIFVTNLVHKLNSLTTLDYGNVIISLIDVGVSYVVALSSRTNYSYNFNSSANTKNSTYQVNKYRLGGNYLINCTNSSIIKDFTYIFKTDVPNSITNIKSGQSISLSADLLIQFAHELPKGSLITIGYGQHFIRIETLQACSSLVVFKNEMQRVLELVKKEDVNECQIGFVEGSKIGTLMPADKITSNRYQLPIFQFTRSYVTVNLKY